jgi:hypothetical protein
MGDWRRAILRRRGRPRVRPEVVGACDTQDRQVGQTASKAGPELTREVSRRRPRRAGSAPLCSADVRRRRSGMGAGAKPSWCIRRALNHWSGSPACTQTPNHPARPGGCVRSCTSTGEAAGHRDASGRGDQTSAAAIQGTVAMSLLPQRLGHLEARQLLSDTAEPSGYQRCLPARTETPGSSTHSAAMHRSTVGEIGLPDRSPRCGIE